MSFEGNGAAEPPKDQHIETRRNADNLPVISGENYQHIGRYAGAVVMSVFEQLGGVSRMVAWADSNYTDFAVKLFPKMIQRSQSIDITASVTIDDAIARLENAPIEGKFTRKSETPIFDL
jgi:hypothetical protein